MEMTSHLPFPKTQPSNAGPAKLQKSSQDDTAAAEVVSFPTLLQENSNSLESGSVKTTPVKPIEGSGQPTATVLNMAAVPMEISLLTEAISPLLSGSSEEITADSVLPSITQESETSAAITTAKVDTLVQEVAASVVEVAASVVEVATSMTEEVVATEPGLVKNVKLEPVTEGQVQSTPVVAAGDDVKIQTPSENSATLTTNVQSEIKSEIPFDVRPEAKITGTEDTKIPANETVVSEGKQKVTTALVEDKPAMPGVEAKPENQEQQQSLPTTENMKVEVVKDAPAPEKILAPVVENPALARQSSAELDMLAAKASAEKIYQQPAVSAESASSAKTTLAALDLDSGSFESAEQKESNITKILSSLNEASSPVKSSIRGQVLNRVVEHLQEEIGKEKLTIRLNPEKLGQVEILFQSKGDQLEITMTSSGRDAEQALQEGTRELAEKIADNSVRYNLVDIKVENKGSEQQSKQESRQEEKREKPGQGNQQEHQEGQPSQADHNHETGAGEWAAYHLGG